MKQLGTIIILFSAFSFLSCQESRIIRSYLDTAERLSTERPDSSLHILESIPRRSFLYPDIKAKYALLYTQAQDRCYIPVSSDSLISQAVAYYKLFGNKASRFKSYYYAGQVAQNAGKKELAMDYYVSAENIKNQDISPAFYCSLHLNKASLYASAYDYDKGIYESEKALSYARKNKNNTAIFRSMLNISQLQFYSGKDIGEIFFLDSLLNRIKQVDVTDQLDFYGIWCEIMHDRVNPVRLAQLVDSLLVLYPGKAYPHPWITWARTYTFAGEGEKALSILSDLEDRDYNAVAYSTLSKTLDSLGRYKESLEAYKKYVSLSDSLDLVLFKQDTRFIEERHASELRHERAITGIIVLIIAFISFVTITLLRVIQKRKENLRLQAMYESLKKEYDILYDVLHKDISINQKAKEKLGERIKALGAFLSEDIPDSLELVSSRLETLTNNRKELIETIGLLFGVYHPSFVSLLLDYNLSTAEIGFCCLLVLGLRTSEIGDVINRSGFYNISSDIRKKLPIEGKKLSTWLTETFQKTNHEIPVGLS